ncbi:FG-GAP repeat domain-containing protein [Paenibacillus contaminans]|uniref:VCBS repeat-containing protein n=1 Tax=Paenibacillus contaminans TaxID=450362 RepID=A0A329MS47_9BACL|nr:VCBS repeat-containing protein [Paenibacillus contaminans]RAV22799.1 VCBS repeat-containing protein [Paenibacillus contaminans]
MLSRWKGWCALTALSLALSGCQLVSSPVDLLRSPQISSSQQERKQAVMQFMPATAKLTVPIRSKQASAIVEADLDGDGTPETVAFYKNEKNEYELGILILQKKDDGWVKLGDLKGVGRELHYVDFPDLNGDGIPEMVIGWSGGNGLTKELSVYMMQQGAMKKMQSLKYDELAGDDLDGDGKTDLVLFQVDRVKLLSSAQLYAIQNGELSLLQTLPLEPAINGFAQAKTGMASATQKGIFVEMGVGAHSSITSLIVKEKGLLRDVFASGTDGEMITFKAYTTLSEDINGDGITEIDILREPSGSEEYAMANMPWIHEWNQWDGRNGLVPVYENYYNNGVGFRFDIPDRWRGRYTVAKQTSDTEATSVFYTVNDSGSKQFELLSIVGIKANAWNERRKQLEQASAKYEMLGANNGFVIYSVLPDGEPSGTAAEKKTFADLRLEKDELAKLLQLYYMEYAQ